MLSIKSRGEKFIIMLWTSVQHGEADFVMSTIRVITRMVLDGVSIVHVHVHCTLYTALGKTCN